MARVKAALAALEAERRRRQRSGDCDDENRDLRDEQPGDP